MLVKRGKKGLIMDLCWSDRIELSRTLEGVEIPSRLKSEESIHNALHAVVLRHLFLRKDMQFRTPGNCRIIITWAESIALMWHLRKYDDSISMLNLKSEIYKHLQA